MGELAAGGGCAEAGGVGFENQFDLVAYAAEFGKDFGFGAGGMGRVGEAPVVAVYLAGVTRACLVGVAAHGDDGGDVAVEKGVHVFRSVGGEVDADFAHDLEGFGVNVAGGFGAGAVHGDEVAGGGAEDALGHVAAAGVAGAEDQDGRCGVHDRERRERVERVVRAGRESRTERVARAGVVRRTQAGAPGPRSAQKTRRRAASARRVRSWLARVGKSASGAGRGSVRR